MNDINKQTYLLSFSIGPVQEFISSARTVRDLWSGSYILSWLTAKAASVIINDPWKGDLLHLEKPEENPLIRLALMEKPPEKGEEGFLLSSLPNMFIAQVNLSNDKDKEIICKEVSNAVEKEWKDIADKVREILDENWKGKLGDEYPKWDEGWDSQVESFWDIRTAIIRYDENAVNTAKNLHIDLFNETEEGKFKANTAILARLAAAQKMIRHYPTHESCREDIETRPKCSLCGAYSQMGPRAGKSEDCMKTAREFWEKVTQKPHISWERIQKKDRFCAIQLIKRFAWIAYFAERTGFKNEPWKKRVWDTATIAAMDWMKEINPNGELLHKKIEDQLMDKNVKYHWSGHWLHWNSRNQFSDDKGDEPPCPEDEWDLIKEARKVARKKDLSEFPPTYYAILTLDGDKMGKRFQNLNQEEYRDVGTSLIDFGLNEIKKIVEEEHLGILVYSGGDDLLALLPASKVLQCAKEIHDSLEGLKPKDNGKMPGGPIKSSAGIAVAHYKYDLREALQEARNAEIIAKNSGRDCLALKILRRSGEHTTTVFPWDCIEHVVNLISQFKDPQGKTDRWSYDLRAEWNQIIGDALLPKEKKTSDSNEEEKQRNNLLGQIIDAELKRRLRRSDNAPEGGEDIWSGIRDSILEKLEDENKGLVARDTTLTLIQSASFLARGKEGE